MKRKINLRLTVALLCFVAMCSQTNCQIVFRGKVLNEATQEPIEGAKIGVTNQGLGVVSKANGSFSYRKYNQVLEDSSKLLISARGFEDLVLEGSQIRAFYNKSGTFALTPSSSEDVNFDFAKQQNIALFWDTSRSSENRNFDNEWQFLEKYFNELGRVNVNFVAFNESIVSQKEFVVNKSIAELKKYSEKLTYQAATSYKILPKTKADVVLLFSDGNPVLGQWSGDRSTPHYLISSLPRANDKFAKNLAQFTTGSFVDLYYNGIEESIEQLKNGVPFIEKKDLGDFFTSGKVMTNTGPIQGASITIKGDLEEFFSKADGTFKLPAQEGDIIEVKYLGMYPKEMLVDNTQNLEVNLIPIDLLLDEVVLEGKKAKGSSEKTDTGFGDTSRESYGFDVKVITSEEIKPTMQFLPDVVRGRFAGVVVNGFGSGATISIRGSDRSAAWVVDGNVFEEPPLWLEIQNIESIALVKGLQASIRYGTVASGGAFIVRTKTFRELGKKGEIVDQALVKGNDYTEQVLQLDFTTLTPDYVQQIEKIEGKEAQYERYQNLADAHINDASYFIDMALHFQKVYPEKAKEIRSRLAEIAQGNPNVLRVLAYLYENANETKNALEIYKRIAVLAPGEAQTYRDLASLYAQTGHYDQSLELYINMLAEQVRGVNFKPIDTAISHELLHLIARHRDKLDLSRLPEQWLYNEFRIDLRMVIQWSDVEAPFEFQFVNPQDKYFKWNHTLLDNQQRLQEEVKSGFQFEEFIIDEAPHGLWRVNIEYLGEEQYKAIPTYLKYTIYRDYGTPEERKETIIIKLTKDIGKVQLHEFLL